MVTMNEQLRSVLSHRSIKDKIAVACDCRLCPVGDLALVSELVREGYLVFVDRTTLPVLAVVGEEMIMGVIVDVYQLTPSGIALCEQFGIKQV
jgi:hypothetical protein